MLTLLGRFLTNSRIQGRQSYCCQAGWEQPPCREALLTQARQKYSPEKVLHIKPPYQGENIDRDFAALGATRFTQLDTAKS
ncbi:hypothetical protein PN36_28395 [Candidatus Thiomargarita nelsonii]|uniref:Uncharacterized protein n=1 Tax=Candidatus Thiomargarita nelsonii TaxID=1003181 RepID=A0A0A6P4J3_9GAMM|nr:hypothetical protein PN36_28395 [Candidatus Thiomargarita nelsonii]